ncbi:MAG: nitroreductase family protein [Clostridia bacterium]|nr:nitroreductase family protein [Clostridia bacterium]
MLEMMRSRRSIRKFEDKPVEKEKLDVIIECALRSPSSMGKRPWKIWTVKDRADLEKMSKAKPHGLDFVAKAPVAFIVAGYPDAADVWIEDCSIVSIVLQLEAEMLGLGSCWGQIRRRMYDENTSSSDYLKSAMGLDADCEVLSIIAIGYKAEEKKGHSGIPSEKVIIK